MSKIRHISTSIMETLSIQVTKMWGGQNCILRVGLHEGLGPIRSMMDLIFGLKIGATLENWLFGWRGVYS